MMHVWRTLKLFVSSTFVDLELERDALSQVFHRTQQQLTSRQLSLIPYDLRWRRRHESTPIAQWCVEMVQRCNYFIGILGHRYGWRPPLDALGSPNDRRISVTEMEIEAALANIDRQRRFFCLVHDEKSSGRKESSEDRLALDALKRRLKETETVYEFATTQEMLLYVEAALREMIDRDYPPGETAAVEEYTRQQALAELVEQKTKGFVGRIRYCQRLLDFASGDGRDNYLLVHAVAGIGKSSLLAKFVDEWRKRQETPLICHFMGMSGNSRQVRELMLNLAEQLSAYGLIEGEVAEDPGELRSQVRHALETAPRLVVVIDALDEIEESGKSLAWLPRYLPATVRVVISTRPVAPFKTLQGYGNLEVMELVPLEQAEIAEIVAHYAETHGLQLSNADRELLQQRADGNPLYLKVALEEIVSTGIAVGQLATSIDSLFEQILQRLQKNYGDEVVLDYLGMIAASRSGLAESELRDLLKQELNQSWSDDLLLEVTRSLDNFLVWRGGLLHFFHSEFERTLKQRFGRQKMRSYHSRLARYFDGRGFVYERTLVELCYQQQWAEEYTQLLATLTNLAFLEARCQANMVDGLLEDYSSALHNRAVPLPVDIRHALDENVVATRKTLLLLSKALALDLRFIRRHPHLLFQCLWNRCYWYDAPAAQAHYSSESDASRVKIFALLEKWQQGKDPTSVWLRSSRPLEPHLDSRLRKTFAGHDQGAIDVVFSEDGRRIASASEDCTVRIWDVDSGECLVKIEDHEQCVRSVCFLSGGKRLVSAADDWLICVWDVDSGECLQILDGHEGPVYDIAASRNYPWLVSVCEDRTVRLWDTTNGKHLRTLEGHSEAVLCVAISPDSCLAASGGKDHEIRVWDLHSGECLRVLRGHQRLVNQVVFDPRGQRLASIAKDGVLKLWDLSSGSCLNSFHAHEDNARSVSFSSDGQRILSCGYDYTVRVWNPNDCENPLMTLRRPEWHVTSIAINPDGDTIVCGARDGSISLWQITAIGEDGEVPLLKGHNASILTHSFNNDGKCMVTGGKDGQICFWNTGNGTCTKTIGVPGAIFSVTFSSDGKKLAASEEHGTIHIYDTTATEVIHSLRGHRGIVSKLFFHQSDRLLVSLGFFDNTIRIWQVASGENLQILTGHEKWIESIAFSQDGQMLASGARDKTLRLWDIETGHCLKVLRGHEMSITSVAFSPDGISVASGGYDGVIRIWNRKNGAPLMVIHAHDDLISDLAFGDDTTLFSTSREHTTAVWDISSGNCLQKLAGKADVYSMADQQKTLFSVIRDWETMILDKDCHAIAFFPAVIETAGIFDKTIAGRGRAHSNDCYIIEMVGR